MSSGSPSQSTSPPRPEPALLSRALPDGLRQRRLEVVRQRPDPRREGGQLVGAAAGLGPHRGQLGGEAGVVGDRHALVEVEQGVLAGADAQPLLGDGLVGPPGRAIGCDLEIVEPRSDAFVEDFLTAAERSLVAGAPDEDARHLLANLVWCGKESALKVLRTGLRRDTRSVEVSLPGGPGQDDCFISMCVAPFTVSNSSSCTSCGAKGQLCCANKWCSAGLSCGTSYPYNCVECGLSGEPCCEGIFCITGTCGGGKCP